MNTITTIDALEALYQPEPTVVSTAKELDRLIPEYRHYIELSPFVTVATAGPGGLDCSPRGDMRGFVRVQDERTVLLPDRRGNNRIDTLRKLVHGPRIGLLFLIPGSGTTLRINGRAAIDDDAALCASFAVDRKAPRTVLVIRVEKEPPQNTGRFTWAGAAAHLKRCDRHAQIHDDQWPGRAAKSMWWRRAPNRA